MPVLDGPDGGLWIGSVGKGSPVTVFAHGLTSSSADIAGLAGRTSGTRVLFDFRGHGRSASPPPSAGYDIGAFSRDLAFVASRFGASQAVGVSMGAAAILRMMASEPARFERVVLMIPAWLDGRAPFPLRPDENLARALEQRAPDDIVEEVLGADPVRALIARQPAWEGRLRAQVLRMNAAGMIHALRATATDMAPVEDASELSRVTAPILILAHEGDPGHDAGIARRLGEIMRNAEVRIWPEPLAMMDDVDACAVTIGEFLAADRATIRR